MCQYIPTTLEWEWGGVPVTVKQDFDSESSTSQPREPDGSVHRPQRWVVELSVHCAQPTTFALKLRLPWWLGGQAQVLVNGEPTPVSAGPSDFHEIRRTWQGGTVRLVLGKALSAMPLPEERENVDLLYSVGVVGGLVCGGRGV